MKAWRVFFPFCALSLLASQPAHAWGSKGHQYVGNLAWQLLNPNARNRVRQMLGPGIDLAHAAVWPDCVRSVDDTPNGLKYHPDRYTPKICGDLTRAEQARMVAYASRNWTNCPYRQQFAQCHKSFHFADVNVHEHQDYDRTYFGTEDYDVVQAIKAAMIVLKCKTGQLCPTPKPFNIESKREALLLLAHFAGDLHQPLHVGALYLDANNLPAGDHGAPTAGGNLLLIRPNHEEVNLHHEWDTILNSIATQPSGQAIVQGCAISPLPNPTPEPTEKWAGESVVGAADAYKNMSFVVDPDMTDHWDILFVDRKSYLKSVRKAQAIQLIRGGARLAALLNSVWPSSKVAPACK